MAIGQGANESLVKDVFLNKVYNDSYLITNVTFERFYVDINLFDDEAWDYLLGKGVLNTPGGLFSTVLSQYDTTEEGVVIYLKGTVNFKEL